MLPAVSLENIDRALSNLNYRSPTSMKSRLVHAIRQFYVNESSVHTLEAIHADSLIASLWKTGKEPRLINKKRKNLNSVRSSVNVDLQKLFKSGDNPDGITINPDNIFVMSDEAKDKTLSTFLSKISGDTPTSLDQISEILNAVHEVLSNPETALPDNPVNRLKKLSEMKNLVQGLADEIDLQEDRGQMPEVGGQGAEDGGQGTEVGGAIFEDEAVLTDADGDTEIIELEEDLEEVELLEEDDIEDADQAGEGQGIGNADGQGEDGTGGNGHLDNHLDAIESGHDPSTPDDPQKTRLLAETFNRSLAAMDKFFNQYIEFAAGDYVVGAKHPKKDEILKHGVTLAPFYMGKFPVTNALFEVFVENTGYTTTAEKLGYGTVYEGRCQKVLDPHSGRNKQIWRADIVSKTVEGACWYQPSGTGSSIHHKRNHPVVQVSAHDALAFTAWTGKRLPSEEEWEAGSRTAKGLLFPWGNVLQPGACNIEESGIGGTTAVDSYPDFENDAGIADALGNVLEWAFCQDPSRSKTGPSLVYVAKGGSWISGNNPRLYSRLLLEPEAHSNILGFRCVAS